MVDADRVEITITLCNSRGMRTLPRTRVVMFEPGWKYLEQVSTYLRAVRQGANPIVAMKGPVFEIITEGVVHDRSHPPGIPVSSPTSTKVNASTATYLLPFTKEGFAELAARVTDLENEFDAIVIANNQA